MAFDGAEQAAIVELMHGKYGQILAIEAEWGIRLHEGDMRPRIEHFHDAVRALTSGSADMYAKNSRLSVENLAYDIGQLRLIQGKPSGLINKATEKSAGSALVKKADAGAAAPKMPPASVRGQITTLYRDYTVFFAALFAQAADLNYQSRSETMDATMSDLGVVERVVKALVAGTMTNTKAAEELAHVEHDDLRERLQAQLSKKTLSPAEKLQIQGMMGQIEKGLRAEQKSLDQSHMHFATGQLAVYEEAKETIKRLQQQGLNLAGKFVENAMSQSSGKGKTR